MNGRTAAIVVVFAGFIVGLLYVFGGLNSSVSPAALAADFGTLRPGLTDVTVGELYELDQPVGISVKDTLPVGRVYEIRFGGADRNRRPMYVYSRDLVVTTEVPPGTVGWVSKSSYRELEGIVYDDSTNTRVRVLVNPRPGQMVKDRSYHGGRPRR